MQLFYLKWLPSSKVTGIADTLHLSSTVLLIIVEIFLGYFACHAVDFVLGAILNRMNKHINAKIIFLILLVICEEYFILQYISLTSTKMVDLEWQNIVIVLSNLGIISGLNLVLYLFINCLSISLCVSSILIWIWGVANYYTILFHGSPLFLTELVNAGTALAVVNSYHFDISNSVVVISLTCVLVLISIITSFDGIEFHFSFQNTLRTMCCILTVIFLAAGLYFFSPSKAESWMPWYLSIDKDGFLVCNVKDIIKRMNPIVKPDGYSFTALNSFVDSNVVIKDEEKDYISPDEYPDIILILNETFCDLDYYSSVSADIDYLQEYENIDRAVYGHAVNSEIGGGTNNSEFELLTSKSMFLLEGVAPFTYLSNDITSRSIIQYLNELGYMSTGMHCEKPQNYNRSNAYHSLGFDNILLGKDAFSYFNLYGQRKWLDSDNYKDLIDCYEENIGMPQFIYLLTYQNHGGYQQNASNLDTVHTALELGNLTEEVNEFLSSLSLSAEAFHELTDYYSNVDRNVIICMVGDHAPSFIANLPEKDNPIINDSSINMRTVPYVIWTNYDIDLSGGYDYATMTDLVPMVLQAADLPMSKFYSYINDMHEALPIRTSDGIYVDHDLETGTYNEASPYYEMLNTYYYMEYNSLLPNKDYCEELFKPYVADGS